MKKNENEFKPLELHSYYHFIGKSLILVKKSYVESIFGGLRNN